MKTLLFILVFPSILTAGIFNNLEDQKTININLKLVRHSELSSLAEFFNLTLEKPSKLKKSPILFSVPEDVYLLVYTKSHIHN